VAHDVRGVADLKGKTLAVRSSGQPHAVTLWLRMMGLEKEVRTVLVQDGEVGKLVENLDREKKILIVSLGIIKFRLVK